MTKLRKLFFVAVLAAVLVPQAMVVTAAEGRLTFIHLNDLHAHLVPHRDVVRQVALDGTIASIIEQRGGLARTATLIKQLRAEEPNSILMNIGDTYYGGAEALYSRGNAIIAPVNALGIDIGVPGNWDFAYGPIVTRLRYAADSSPFAHFVNNLLSNEPIATPNYPVLAGNVSKTFSLMLEDEPLLPATHLQSFGGITVGFIGITSDIVPRMSPVFAWGFSFLEGEKAYTALVNEHALKLRQAGAELVVVMSELGLHRDHQLANVIAPGVDVFFSAHTHEATTVPLSSRSGALVVEAGNDGFLGKMTVTLSQSSAPKFEWQLLPINEHITKDPELMELVAVARAPFLDSNVNFEHPMPFVDLPLTESIETVVGSAPATLHRRSIIDSPFNHFLADQMRRHYETDLALTPGFRFDAVVEAGDSLTLEHLYRYLPVPPTLARARISGQNLKAVLETELTRVFSGDAFQHSGGWLMGVGGLNIDVDTSRGQNDRVINMFHADSGEKIGPAELLSVVSCTRPFDDEGVLCSNHGFLDVEPLEGPAGKGWTPLEFLRYRLESKPILEKRIGQVKDLSNPTEWPVGKYMQPLHVAPESVND